MVKIPSPIKNNIEKFLNAVRQHYHIQEAYLYGSQAKGKATSWSDIDIALGSSDFSNDLFEERLALMRLAAQIDDRIEPYPFTEETFNINNPIASDIQKHGLLLG